MLFLFGIVSTNGIGEGDSSKSHKDNGDEFSDYRL